MRESYLLNNPPNSTHHSLSFFTEGEAFSCLDDATQKRGQLQGESEHGGGQE